MSTSSPHSDHPPSVQAEFDSLITLRQLRGQPILSPGELGAALRGELNLSRKLLPEDARQYWDEVYVTGQVTLRLPDAQEARRPAHLSPEEPWWQADWSPAVEEALRLIQNSPRPLVPGRHLRPGDWPRLAHWHLRTVLTGRLALTLPRQIPVAGYYGAQHPAIGHLRRAVGKISPSVSPQVRASLLEMGAERADASLTTALGNPQLALSLMWRHGSIRSAGVMRQLYPVFLDSGQRRLDVRGLFHVTDQAPMTGVLDDYARLVHSPGDAPPLALAMNALHAAQRPQIRQGLREGALGLSTPKPETLNLSLMPLRLPPSPPGSAAEALTLAFVLATLGPAGRTLLHSSEWTTLPELRTPAAEVLRALGREGRVLARRDNESDWLRGVHLLTGRG